MYAGHMVEIAPTASSFRQPRHPYTRGLIASVPRLDEAERNAAATAARAAAPRGAAAWLPVPAALRLRRAVLRINGRRSSSGGARPCRRLPALARPGSACRGDRPRQRAAARPRPTNGSRCSALESVSFRYGATGQWLA